MTSDSIADMLTRIRNANQAHHRTVEIPVSKMKVEIARVLTEEGFVDGYEVSGEAPMQVLTVTLKPGSPRGRALSGLRRISRPGLRVYARKSEIPRVLGGLGVAIISTSRGLMTGRAAQRAGLGGEVVPFVWGVFLMSRIGKLPIPVPTGVEVALETGNRLSVTGSRGTLQRTFAPSMLIKVDGGIITVARPSDARIH